MIRRSRIFPPKLFFSSNFCLLLIWEKSKNLGLKTKHVRICCKLCSAAKKTLWKFHKNWIFEYFINVPYCCEFLCILNKICYFSKRKRKLLWVYEAALIYWIELKSMTQLEFTLISFCVMLLIFSKKLKNKNCNVCYLTIS